MQAAFISYAVFLAMLLLLVIVVFIIVSVRSLLAFVRKRRDKSGTISGQQTRI
jgi:hypothetical protein